MPKKATTKKAAPVAQPAAPAQEAAIAAAPALAATAPAPAAPVAPQKKSHAVLIVVLVLLFFFVVMPMLVVGGLGWFAKKKIDDATKNGIGIGNGIGVNTSQNQKWPTNMPSIVPQFKAGTITASGRLGDVWTVSINNVKKTDYDSYKTQLVAAGWTIENDNVTAGIYSYSAKKGDYSINPMFTPSENSLVFGVVKQSTETTTEQ